jgi:hypothetical protein
MHILKGISVSFYFGGHLGESRHFYYLSPCVVYIGFADLTYVGIDSKTIPLVCFVCMFRPKIKKFLFPLYLPTQQNGPTQHILFANFKSKYFYFDFAPKMSKSCPILLHLHTRFVKQIKKMCYLPTDSVP